MSIFNFFKWGKNKPTEEADLPWPEQQAFAEMAEDVFTPVLQEKGFQLLKAEAEKYFSSLTYRKGTQYIKIAGSTFPTDYPYSYNVILGDGNSEDVCEYDWNSIALWQMVQQLDPSKVAKEYPFPFELELSGSLIQAKDDLLRYGISFLDGDLTVFADVRSQINQNRTPYRISSVDEHGERKITFEPKSVEMKNKYS